MSAVSYLLRVLLSLIGVAGTLVAVFVLSGPMLFPLISTSFGRPTYPDVRDAAPFVLLVVVSVFLAALAPRGPEVRRVQAPGLVGVGVAIVPAAFFGAAFWQSLDDSFGKCAFAGCWPSLPQQALIIGAWVFFAALLVVQGWKLAPRLRYLVLIPIGLAAALGLYWAVWAIAFHEFL